MNRTNLIKAKGGGRARVMEERVLVEKKWEIKFGWVKGIWDALVDQMDTDCQVV